MLDDPKSSDAPELEDSNGEPIIAHWPGDWPGRHFVNLDNVGDPGWWLNENLASEDELMDDDSDDEDTAKALADSYIRKGHEMGFPLPSDFEMSEEKERETIMRDFLGFIREWRRRTLAERNSTPGAGYDTAGPLQTWNVLKEFGFQADAGVISDIHPGLSFDFGTFKLSASAVMNMHLAEVVVFTGLLATSRSLTEVQFEMPRRIESREKCAAWLTWNLDKHADDVFQAGRHVSWLDLGRTYQHLLPWFVDMKTYEARPHCYITREWARLLLNELKAVVALAAENSAVWFSFDGEVLKIRCGVNVMATAARGAPWPAEYGLKAAQLRELPRRFMQPQVEFSALKDRFHIGNWRYEGVVLPPASDP